jgi:hypothetical protein
MSSKKNPQPSASKCEKSKDQSSAALGSALASSASKPLDSNASASKRKLKPEAILTHTFGDLMKFSKRAPDVQAPFRKYDAFAVAMAEQPREERLMMYGFLMGLSLTAHARRITDPARRRSVFDSKNRIFLALANNFSLRKVLNFRLCQSKRFKVIKYCDDCVKGNTEAGTPPRQWKFCHKCEVDRNYYNVLSMFHKHEKGGASLFLGNDLMAQVRGLKFLKRAKHGLFGEEVTFTKYTFSPKNLVALELKSVEAASARIVDLLEKMRDTDLDKFASTYVQQGGQIRARVPGSFKPEAGPIMGGGGGGFPRPAIRPQRPQNAPWTPKPREENTPPGSWPTPAIVPASQKTGITPRIRPVAKPGADLNEGINKNSEDSEDSKSKKES